MKYIIYTVSPKYLNRNVLDYWENVADKHILYAETKDEAVKEVIAKNRTQIIYSVEKEV